MFRMKRKWWRQKFSAAITSVIIFADISVLLQTKFLKSTFEINSNKDTDR